MKLHILQPIYNLPERETKDCIDDLAGAFDCRLYQAQGFSDVARARQEVATKAFEHNEISEGDVVLWLDGDNVIDVDSAKAMVSLCGAEGGGFPVLANYVKRNEPSQLVGVINQSAPSKFVSNELGFFTLRPLSGGGMGCLFLPARMFLNQIMASPLGGVNSRRLICSGGIRYVKGAAHYIGEDVDYYLRLESPVYWPALQEDKNWKNPNGLRYIVSGHKVSRIAYPALDDYFA